ncbi:MAG: hypothetical protein AB8C84_03645 [Oligoflexales bacterium]
MIRTTAPTRIDLAGGTFDIWPIHQVFPQACTVNLGISLNATTTLQPNTSSECIIESEDQNTIIKGSLEEILQSKELPLHRAFLDVYRHEISSGFHLKTKCLSPAGAGVGGSSCLAVTMLKALHEWLDIDCSEHQLVATARDVEARVIHTPTGVQDYWGAVRGGANILSWPPGQEHVETYTWPTSWDSSILLCYSGKPRQSAINNWELYRRVFDKNPETLETFTEMAHTARQCASALRNHNLEKVFSASKEEWSLRRQLWPHLETDETKAIDTAATQAGAYFSRVCGAGGGGVMLIMTPPEHRQAVTQAVQTAGGQVLEALPTNQGLRLLQNQRTIRRSDLPQTTL